MNRLAVPVILALATVAAPAALADEVAAERARLANARILAEEEQRARAEAEQAERAEAEKPAASPEAEKQPPAADRIEMSRALEQLRELGALRDAGYLTEEEFRMLKEKILDGAL